MINGSWGSACPLPVGGLASASGLPLVPASACGLAGPVLMELGALLVERGLGLLA